VLLAGAYVVHTLRYVLAFGSGAGGELLAQGHGYLAAAPPVLTVLLAAAVGGLVLRLAAGAEGRAAEPSVGRVWGVSATALLAMFVAQESAEGWLATGHQHGWAAVFAHGGWLAAPLAASVGLLVALLHRGAAAALAAPRARAPRPRTRPVVALVVWCLPGPGVWRVEGPWLGGRGPPAPAG